jgi:hypothetical protein
MTPTYTRTGGEPRADTETVAERGTGTKTGAQLR